MRRFLLSIAMAGVLPAGAAFAQQSPSGAGAYNPPSGASSSSSSSSGIGSSSSSGTGDYGSSDVGRSGSSSVSGQGTESVPPAETAPAPGMGPSTEAMPAPSYQPVSPVAEKPRHRMSGPTAHAQAGLLAFPGRAHDILNPGFSYGAGIGFDARQAVGLEVNYQGAVYGTKNSLAGPQETIAENGGEALLKVGPRTRFFDAYALGGYGLSFANAAEQPGSAGVVQDDWISKVPVGLGVNVKVPTTSNADVTLGARSTYDFLFNNKAYSGLGGGFATDNGNSGRSGDQINTQLTLGGKF